MKVNGPEGKNQGKEGMPGNGEACMPIFHPTPGLNGERLSALGSQQKGP